MFCPKCGSENENECNFCRKCGQSLSDLRNRQMENNKDDFEETASIPKNRKNNIIITIVIILACVITFVGGYVYFYEKNKPKVSKTSQSISQNINENGDKSNKDKNEKDNSTEIDSSKDDKTTEENKGTDSGVSSDKSSQLYNFKCGNDEYICSALSETYLTEEDFSNLSKYQIQLLINEIYAKNGYKFSHGEWADYFSNKTWYVGVKTDIAESEFNNFERSNLEILKKFRETK